MSNDPRRLGDVLNAGALAELGREAERRRTATAEIRALLPPAEAAHLVSATRNETGELVLVMDSPVWAARARYTLASWTDGPVRIRVLPRGAV